MDRLAGAARNRSCFGAKPAVEAAEEFFFPGLRAGIKGRMLTRFLPTAVLAVIAAALMVLSPTGAAAHGGHVHVHAAPQGIPVAAVKDAAPSRAIPAEMRAQNPAPGDVSFDWTCADRGCCGNGHCWACGNAIAPSCLIDFALAIGAALPSHNAVTPSALADEGPPRPPKTFA